MCKKIEELVANQFKNLTGVNVVEGSNLLEMEVFPEKREPFKQLLRCVLPDLRLRSSLGLVRVADFADYVEEAEKKKKDFFQEGLAIIKTVTGDEMLTFDSDLYAELRPKSTGNANLSEQTRYFLTANRVYTALAKGLKGDHSPYYPPVSMLEKSYTLQEIIDLYYRRGKF